MHAEQSYGKLVGGSDRKESCSLSAVVERIQATGLPVIERRPTNRLGGTTRKRDQTDEWPHGHPELHGRRHGGSLTMTPHGSASADSPCFGGAAIGHTLVKRRLAPTSSTMTS